MGKNSNNNDDDFDVVEYRKFLSNMFPSKHMKEKVKADKKNKELIDKIKSKKEKAKKNKNKYEKEKEQSSSSESESESESDSDSESESESECKKRKNKKNKDVNIIFTLSEKDIHEIERRELKDLKNKHIYDSEDDDDSDSDYEDDSESESEDDDDDDDEEEDVSEDDDDENETKQKRKNSKRKKQNDTNDNDDDDDSIEELVRVSKYLRDNKKENSTIKECMKMCDEKIKKKEKNQNKKNKKESNTNLKDFKKRVKDKNLKDIGYYKKLSLTEQKQANEKMDEINELIQVKKPYRFMVLDADIPITFKAAAMNKINSIRYMDPGNSEYYKIKNWIDMFMRIPFNKYNELDVSIDHGVEKCHEFMKKAQQTLDEAVYGLNDAKLQIIQMLGQFITNPKAVGTSIAIHGPPGTGKTSLVKEGISKILNRPFSFIALGGATDSSTLDGHSYTYEGSIWGKIVQILADSKCMNPIIYFDELDKVSDTPKGEEIIGILTHLTDTAQNSQFHDKYFSELDLDLSKCLFIFSYNDESKINPILKDRMYRIQTKGYTNKEKTVIVNDYLLPKIRDQVKFSEEEIVIPKETISHLMEHHNVCNQEKGVRNLKRCLEIIYTKLNLFRLMETDDNLFEKDMAINVEFPMTVTRDVVDKLIKNDKENISALYSMYM
jgi:ATP-dependent Lon protease